MSSQPVNGLPAHTRVMKEITMPTSQNGWSASPDLPTRPLVVDGVAFIPGIRDDDDVATVLGYVLTQFHERVEPLRNPGCWGFSYRPNRNDPTSLSNHSSGTAVDANAPAHPNGVPTAQTFTPTQIAEVHQILAEVDHAVRWGGDYTITPDSMHFEINTNPTTLREVAARLEDDMPYTEQQLRAIISDEIAKQVPEIAKAAAKEFLNADVISRLGVSVREALREDARKAADRKGR